jgi:hypothetical protein
MTFTKSIAGDGRAKNRLRILLYAASTLLLVAPLIDRLHRPLEINTDASIYLQFAELMLHGQIPYVDFGDLNPPLIMYLSVVPRFFAEHSGVAPIVAFSIFVFLVTVKCTLFSWYFIARNKGLSGAARSCITLAVPFISLVMLFQYGQRDHMGIYFVLPFFFMRLQQILAEPAENKSDQKASEQAQPLPLWTRLSAGLLAGFGPCLKPENLIPILLFEIFGALRKSPVRLNIKEAGAAYACMIAVGLAYLGHFFFLPKAMFERYFHFIVPLVQRGYHCYDCSLTEVVLYPFLAAPLLIAVVVGGAFILRRDRLSALFYAWMVAGYAVCIFYHTFMPHHIIVMEAGAVLLTATIVGLFAEKHKWLTPLTAVAMLGFGAWTITDQSLPSPMRSAEMMHMAEIIKEKSQKGDYVAMLGTNISPPYPFLVQQDRLQGLRYPYLFTLSIYQYIKAKNGDLNGFENLPDETFTVVSSDIATNKPKLVFVFADKNSQGCDPGFSLIDWLRDKGLFAGALKQYKHIDRVAHYDVFERQN